MFSKYCTSTVHVYSTNGPYRVQAKAKKNPKKNKTKTHKKNNNPKRVSGKHPMCSSTLACIKEVRKGLETNTKALESRQFSFTTIEVQITQARYEFHWFIAVLLSGFPSRGVTFLYSTLVFQDENLPWGNAERLGFDTETSGWTFATTPQPIACRYGHREPTAPNKWRVNQNHSVSPKLTHAASSCSMGEHVAKGATRGRCVVNTDPTRLWANPDPYGQQNAQHLNMQEKGRNARAAGKVQCIVRHTKRAVTQTPSELLQNGKQGFKGTAATMFGCFIDSKPWKPGAEGAVRVERDLQVNSWAFQKL